MRHSIAFLLCGLICLSASVVPAGDTLRVDPEARQVLLEAKARAVDIPKQAEAIADLAWPLEGIRNPDVQQLAREAIVNFGKFGLRSLRDRLKDADPIYQADITAAIIEAQRVASGVNTPDYLPALEEAIWFGSMEAQRVAMLEIVHHSFPTAVLSMIDAIVAHPELTVPGIQALGKMGDVRARYFLRRVLLGGEPRYKYEAARSLGMLGDEGRGVLSNETQSKTREVREAAMGEFLNAAVVDDLTLLYEYVATHESDDPILIGRIRTRAELLEAKLEQMQLSEAASADVPLEEPADDDRP